METHYTRYKYHSQHGAALRSGTQVVLKSTITCMRSSPSAQSLQEQKLMESFPPFLNCFYDKKEQDCTRSSPELINHLNHRGVFITNNEDGHGATAATCPTIVSLSIRCSAHVPASRFSWGWDTMNNSTRVDASLPNERWSPRGEMFAKPRPYLKSRIMEHSKSQREVKQRFPLVAYLISQYMLIFKGTLERLGRSCVKSCFSAFSSNPPPI